MQAFNVVLCVLLFCIVLYLDKRMVILLNAHCRNINFKQTIDIFWKINLNEHLEYDNNKYRTQAYTLKTNLANMQII